MIFGMAIVKTCCGSFINPVFKKCGMNEGWVSAKAFATFWEAPHRMS